MNTMHPGIFIPLLTRQGDVNISRTEDIIPQGSTKLFHALLKAEIQGDFFTSTRFSGRKEQPVDYGLTLHLKHPHQMEYQKALQTINHTFGLQLDELTIPLNNVPSPGFGIITKSVYVEIASGPCNILEFNEQAFKLRILLRQPFLYDCKLILKCTVKGFEIHGTSPISEETNRDAWQQHLGKALRRAGYAPIFTQTWSTNTEIANSLTEKCRERHQKEEQDYIAKIQTRNARLPKR